jgi:tetratricopeptide (TPR) repeat protein
MKQKKPGVGRRHKKMVIGGIIALVIIAGGVAGLSLWIAHNNQAHAPQVSSYPIDKQALVLDGRSNAVATASAIATAQATKGDTNGAIQTLTTAVKTTTKRDEKVSLLLQLATVYEIVGKKTEAVSASQSAIALDPTNWQLYKALGNVYIDSGDVTDAVASYQKADNALKGTNAYATYHSELAGLIGDAEASR